MAARYKPSQGFKPDKLMRDALSVALHREAVAADGKPTKKLALVANALVEVACGGDVAAIREIFDRMDGRPAQRVEGSFDGLFGELSLEQRYALDAALTVVAGAASADTDRESPTHH